MEGTEEEKAMAADTIESLREELRVLKIELAAVKQSRDQYQSENGQMKKQIASYVKKLKAQE
jgi:FtsZ-binding cell division protein ZapB